MKKVLHSLFIFTLVSFYFGIPSVSAMEPIKSGEGFVQIESNHFFTCALSDTGKAFCNSGLSSNSSLSFKEVTGLSTGDFIKELFGNRDVMYALTDNKKLYILGDYRGFDIDSGSSRLASFSTFREVSLVDEKVEYVFNDGFQEVYIATDKGNIYVLGIEHKTVKGDNEIIPLKILSIEGGVKKIVSNKSMNYLISNTGELYGWGYSENLILRDGDIIQWKVSIPKKIQIPGVKIKDVVILDRLKFKVYAITEDGEVYAWGSNNEGALGIGKGNPEYVTTPTILNFGGEKILEVFGNRTFNLSKYALTESGKIYRWGKNTDATELTKSISTFGEPLEFELSKPFENIISLPTYSMGRTLEGDVYIWGKNIGKILGEETEGFFGPTKLDFNGEKIVKLYTEEQSSYAITESGGLYQFGYTFNPLSVANNQPISLSKPVKVGTTKAVADIETKLGVLYVMHADGTVSATGNNAYGTLGVGKATTDFFNTVDKLLPVLVSTENSNIELDLTFKSSTNLMSYSGSTYDPDSMVSNILNQIFGDTSSQTQQSSGDGVAVSDTSDMSDRKKRYVEAIRKLDIVPVELKEVGFRPIMTAMTYKRKNPDGTTMSDEDIKKQREERFKKAKQKHIKYLKSSKTPNPLPYEMREISAPQLMTDTPRVNSSTSNTEGMSRTSTDMGSTTGESTMDLEDNTTGTTQDSQNSSDETGENPEDLQNILDSIFGNL